MQCACAILSSVSFPALQFFFTFSHNTIFGKEKVTEHKLCVLIFLQLSPETFLILRRTERDMIRNVHWSSCKVRVNLICISVSATGFTNYFILCLLPVEYAAAETTRNPSVYFVIQYKKEKIITCLYSEIVSKVSLSEPLLNYMNRFLHLHAYSVDIYFNPYPTNVENRVRS